MTFPATEITFPGTSHSNLECANPLSRNILIFTFKF